MKNIIGAAQAPSAPAAQLVEIGPDAEGQRLDNYLLRVLKGVPKTHVYRIIRSGEVRVNKGRADAATRLALGDSVRLPPLRLSERAEEKAEAMARSTPARSFPVLYEDEAFLAIDKPAGVAVHGGSGVDFGVIEQLRMARPGAPMLELVHRLDRETSGVLLVAKKRSALRHLQDQFRERETGKTYLALALGQWPAKCKVLDKPLVRYLLPGKPGTEGERRMRIAAADDPQGMRSITLVRVAETFADYSLLEVTIKTGRTHQIRVHLASEGHAIAGDDKYGDFALNKALVRQGLSRMFLHAWRLRLTHPASGETVQLEAALPPDLAGFLAACRPAVTGQG
ncbi:RluA family pseudouridine synthase [Pseudorhodoferax sp. LjRoot39]|uniref:RluA family pseudouridine synthase n=1 Tax=Pseudorhodoferax sp. LjRoot39 TaxID=3342328 RepID=UPI003ED0837E